MGGAVFNVNTVYITLRIKNTSLRKSLILIIIGYNALNASLLTKIKNMSWNLLKLISNAG